MMFHVTPPEIIISILQAGLSISQKEDDKFASIAKKDCILIGYGEKEGIYWILEKILIKLFKVKGCSI